MIPILDSFFNAMAAGLKVWDHYNKTRYYRQYKKIMVDIQLESGKPMHKKDQSKIDHLQFKLMMLLGDFRKETEHLDYDEKDI